MIEKSGRFQTKFHNADLELILCHTLRYGQLLIPILLHALEARHNISVSINAVYLANSLNRRLTTSRQTR